MNIYERLRSMVYVSRLYAQGTAITDDDQRIMASGLYEDWQPGSYQVGDVRNAVGQTWECFQAHDNATYPDIIPDNPAWLHSGGRCMASHLRRHGLLYRCRARTTCTVPGSTSFSPTASCTGARRTRRTVRKSTQTRGKHGKMKTRKIPASEPEK